MPDSLFQVQKTRPDRSLAEQLHRRHQAPQQLLSGEVRILPRLRGGGDVEPQHEPERGLFVFEHLGAAAAQDSPQD